MEEDTFVINIRVENKGNKVKVSKKTKDVLKEELESQIRQDADAVIDMIRR